MKWIWKEKLLKQKSKIRQVTTLEADQEFSTFKEFTTM